ncbi:MAG: glycosyl transferase [Candidatus Dadabacteria bacterium]
MMKEPTTTVPKKIQMNEDTFISIVIPVYNGEKTVDVCLKSVFSSDYKRFEVIVVDDNSTDNSLRIVNDFPCKVVRTGKNIGPAAARNRGAEASSGEVLFFLDSDIIVARDTIRQIVKAFKDIPDISALFCSYQKNTVPSNFYSVYKNLFHYYTHQTSREDAATFCGGFGAIKRNVFFRLGGFNENYKSLEDIELGYRLYQSGYKIYLDKNIRLTHCKKYNLLSLIKSDVINRAIPWTKIMLDKRIFRNDLNTKVNNVLSVPVSFLLLFNLPGLYFFSGGLYLFVLLFGFFLLLNRGFYIFVMREKGISFTIKAILMNWFNYLYSGVGLIIGILSFLKESRLRSKPQSCT